MKRNILFNALLAVATIMIALGANAKESSNPVSMKITLKDNSVVQYLNADLDSVRFIGGRFGDQGAVGMKVYVHGQTQSTDYLYSQITDVEYGLEAPTFSYADGSVFTQNTVVTITAANGATIYYTDNGYDPSTNYYAGTGVGSVTVTINEYYYSPVVIKAIAVSGSETSSMSQVTYTLQFPVNAPTFSPASGQTFTNRTSKVTISTTTPNAVVYYTTDGTTPSATHNNGSGDESVQVTVNQTMTIKAVAVKNGVSSDVVTASYTVDVPIVIDDNMNRNSLSDYYDASKEMYNLEWPRIKDDDNQSWLKKTSDGMTSYQLEWDNSKIANRFTCYQMYDPIYRQNVARTDDFKEDEDLPRATRSTLSDYSGSGYDRGHLCPAADRRYSTDMVKQTCLLSNMQPQIHYHNGGQWATLEGNVRTWAQKYDTLYVVKAATIDNVTLNGTTVSGVKDERCNGRLLVPKYFYMALMGYKKATNSYTAVGIWTYHATKKSEVVEEYITIDELEARTGLDFFCNLPDDTEATVEASYDPDVW